MIDYVNTITPRMARILARDRKSHAPRALTGREIAAASGLPKRKVDWISLQDTWGKVLVHEMCAFLKGCGITPSNRGKEIAYLKKTLSQSGQHLKHLDTLPHRFKKRLVTLPATSNPGPQLAGGG